MNELDIDYISIKDLRLHFSEVRIWDSEIIDLERWILQALDWDVAVTCPCLFSESLVQLGICFSDDQVDESDGSKKCLKEQDSYTQNQIQQVEKYLNFLENFTLQHEKFFGFPNSVKALSSFVAAWKACWISPAWHDLFGVITGLTYSHIQDCVDLIFVTLNDYFNKRST